MSLLYGTLYKSCPAVLSRTFHASSSLKNDNFEKMLFNLQGFHKYGLLKDDLLTELKSDVAEAVRRLPEEERMQRIHRAIRAQQAYINHSYLPKDQWTKFEDNHYYLQPYLNEVLMEKKEMDEWEATH